MHWKVLTDKGEYSDQIDNPSGSVHISCQLNEETLKSVSAKLEYKVQPSERIFMNGYQTWTYCPEYTPEDKIRGLHGIPRFLVNQFHFDKYGDYHFVDYPDQKGITHGFSWCYFRQGDHYKLIASLNEKNGYTMFTYDAVKGTLKIEKDAAGYKASGKYAAMDLFFAEGNEKEVFDAWFQELNIKPRTQAKLYGYSSWYNRYQKIDESSILKDLENCKSIFKEGDLFQIDDGWEPFVGDWLNPDEKKFPSGMKKLADEIHKAGFKAGLWLAPFVAETKSEIFQKHPDWFYQVNGQPWCDGSNWSSFYSLDIDNPEVMDYLRKVFHQVYDEWGFDLVKLDFLYSAAPFGSQAETRAGRMYRAMEFLREVSGDHLILGCGVPVMPAFGIVDYCRISCDVSLDWDDKFYMRRMHRERTSTRQAIGNTLFRRELNGRAYLSDPDVFFLRTSNIHLDDNQKMELAECGALLGGVFLTSDDPGSYTEEMKKTYRELRDISENAVVESVDVTDEDFTITCLLDGRERTFSYRRS